MTKSSKFAPISPNLVNLLRKIDPKLAEMGDRLIAEQKKILANCKLTDEVAE